MGIKTVKFNDREMGLLTELLEMYVDDYGSACEDSKDYNIEIKFVNKIYEKLTGEKDAFALEED